MFLVNGFIFFNLLVIPALFLVSNKVDQTIEAQTYIIWDGSFDNGENSSWGRFTSDATKEYRINESRYSGKKYVYVKTSPSGQRAEFASKGGEGLESHGVREGERAAHAISIRFPTESCGSKQKNSWFIIYQEKNRISNTATGESFGLSPQRSLDLSGDGGLYLYVRGGDIAKIPRGNLQSKKLFTPQKGVWYDIVLDAKYHRSDGWVDAYIKKI